MDQLLIGDIVHGYLGGYFGRDHYTCSRVEAFGADWAVIRELGSDQQVRTGTGNGIIEELQRARDPGATGNHSVWCPADSDDD